MKVEIEAQLINDRLVQVFTYGREKELNDQHCIHGIKLRWSCDDCEDWVIEEKNKQGGREEGGG